MVTFNDPPIFLKEMIENFKNKPNMLRLINRCCRPVIQRTSINYLRNKYSTLYLNGIPYAVDSRYQFLEPAFLIFNNFDHTFNNWNINYIDYVSILEICKRFLNFNGILKNYIVESLDKIGGCDKYVALIQNIADQGMNLAMIESGSIFQKENPIEIIENSISEREKELIDEVFYQNIENLNDKDILDDDHYDLDKMVEMLSCTENSDEEEKNITNENFNNFDFDEEVKLSNEEEEEEEETNKIRKSLNIFEKNTTNDTLEYIEDSIDGYIINENLHQTLNNYKTKQIYAGDSDYDILIYPLLFWNGEGGCGKLKDESKLDSWAFRYSLISMCMQNPSYYFNRCSALKEEFICSVYGRILQLRINYQFNLQKNLYMKKEIFSNSNQTDNLKYGIKTYVPSTFTGSYQYWRKVSNQGFYMTLILGPPKFFVTITFNPKWNEVVALNPKDLNIIHNSPLIARIFNQKKLFFRLY